MSPDSPMRFAPSRVAASRIFSQDTMTPRSMTSKLLHCSTTPTMFLPMSCTSPLTVAMTTLPLERLAPGFLLLDVRNQHGDGFLHHARGFHHLRQEHLARAEQIADHVHAVHQRTFDDIQRPRRLQAGFFRVREHEFVQPLDQSVLQARGHRQLAPFQIIAALLPRCRPCSCSAISSSRSVASARRARITSSTRSRNSGAISS